MGKDTNEQPATEIVDLKLHVIIGKDRQVQTGYFTVRYQYISVTFLQVIRQENVHMFTTKHKDNSL